MLGFRNREEANVDAPPEAVFAVVSDLASHAGLAGSGEVNAVRRLDDGPLGVGATFQGRRGDPRRRPHDEDDGRVQDRRIRPANHRVVDIDAIRAAQAAAHPMVVPALTASRWHPCPSRMQVDFDPASVLWKMPYAVMHGGAVKRGMRKTPRTTCEPVSDSARSRRE